MVIAALIDHLRHLRCDKPSLFTYRQQKQALVSARFSFVCRDPSVLLQHGASRHCRVTTGHLLWQSGGGAGGNMADQVIGTSLHDDLLGAFVEAVRTSGFQSHHRSAKRGVMLLAPVPRLLPVWPQSSAPLKVLLRCMCIAIAARVICDNLHSKAA